MWLTVPPVFRPAVLRAPSVLLRGCLLFVYGLLLAVRCLLLLMVCEKVEGEKTCASRNAIALDGSTLVIYKQTVANNFTET